MTTIREGVVEYLALRRILGFTLRGVEWMLGHFVRYVELEGAKLLTTELAVRWARLPAHSQAATWSARLSAVRQFAAWSLSKSTAKTNRSAVGVAAAWTNACVCS
jgi:hypothetical protein